MSRRWFQFSLRGFLVALTVFAVWLGWQVDRARQQREAIKAIAKGKGKTFYEWELDPVYAEPINGKVPECPIPEWLCRCVGDDLLFRVARIEFGIAPATCDITVLEQLDTNRLLSLSLPYPISSSTLASLPAMANLKSIDLGPSEINEEKRPFVYFVTFCSLSVPSHARLPIRSRGNLSPLRGMRLTYLICYGSQVTDLSPLNNRWARFIPRGRNLLCDPNFDQAVHLPNGFDPLQVRMRRERQPLELHARQWRKIVSTVTRGQNPERQRRCAARLRSK